MKWQPKEYQKRAMKFCLSQGAAGLFLDPGLGKSSIMLGVITTLLRQKLIGKVLVIAPLRVCYGVWPEEVRKWDEFSHLRVEVLHGPKKHEALAREADIYLINPEGLEWLTKQAFDVDVLVTDESTKFKRTNTKRFKLLKLWLGKFRRRYILTGTPAPNGYLDLFGQIYILDGGAALGRYITHYRMNYFFQSGYGGYEWKLLPGADERIQKAIKPLVMRMEAKDYLDLPPIVFNTVKVQLPEEAMRVYKAVEDELIVRLQDGTEVVSANAAVASGKCRQVANGALYFQDEQQRKWQALHSAKLDALEDLVEEASGQPVLVVYEFEHDLERLLELFGKDTPYLGGGVSPGKSVEIQGRWNAGQVPVLLGHPKSMGHGLNLQKGGHILVWFTPTWDLELYDQTNKRLHRQGTSERVIVHHIIAENTLDEVVLKTLQGKDRTQQQLLEALKDYAAKSVEPVTKRSRGTATDRRGVPVKQTDRKPA